MSVKICQTLWFFLNFLNTTVKLMTCVFDFKILYSKLLDKRT